MGGVSQSCAHEAIYSLQMVKCGFYSPGGWNRVGSGRVASSFFLITRRPFRNTGHAIQREDDITIWRLALSFVFAAFSKSRNGFNCTRQGA